MIITDERQIGNIKNEYFLSITKKLSFKASISLKDPDLNFIS